MINYTQDPKTAEYEAENGLYHVFIWLYIDT